MPQPTITPSAIQGIAMPNLAIDPMSFYSATRRLRFAMKSRTTFAGIGNTDTVELRKAGIVDVLEVRVKGNVVFGGTITGTTMTYEWPLNLIKNFRLSANGQSNLIQARGMVIRVHELVDNKDINNEISKTFNGATQNTGTLALATDDWGTNGANIMAPNSTVAAIGTYTVDLSFFIPVAADHKSLSGAIFAQTSATNLTLSIDWNTSAALVSLGGSATVDFSGLQFSVIGCVFSIPSVGGKFPLPDLSHFHQIAEWRQSGLGQNTNDVSIPGVGVGRGLLRLIFNVYSGATPAPLAMTDANFNLVDWAYGGATIPEAYANGGDMRIMNLRLSGEDMGAAWGIGVFDFVNIFALRDVVDEGETADLRLQVGLVNAPTAGYIMAAQETLFAAPVGA